jgi:uncharacterized protein YheU (UPF0270 family)
MSTHSEVQAPIEVNISSLSAEALQGIIESFVLREGTDYGVNELSLEKKVENLKKKLHRKEIFLVFDPNTESITFLTQSEWAKIKLAHQI